MSAICFWNTVKGYLPQFYYILGNLGLLGKKLKTLECSVTGSLLSIYIHRGK